MNIQEIKKLIKIVEGSEIGELEIIEEGRKIRISKNSVILQPSGTNGGSFSVAAAPVAPPAVSSGNNGQRSVSESVSEQKEVAVDTDKYYEVRSPMVGTFYRAPAPDADPYVEMGDVVSPGQTLCIIEAMKLMNEIPAEVGGRVAKILVENAQPVEYNQVLFLIEKI